MSASTIQMDAFTNKTTLEHVRFEHNSSCTSILSNAFEGCNNLTSINIHKILFANIFLNFNFLKVHVSEFKKLMKEITHDEYRR